MMQNLSRALRLFLVVAIGALLSSCSWGIWDFMRDKDEIRPNRLVDFDEEVRLRRNWSTNIGSGQGDKFNRLKPALVNGVIYITSNNGLVAAFQADNGDRLWRQDLDVEISGGVGANAGLVLVGTENADIYALDQKQENLTFWQKMHFSTFLFESYGFYMMGYGAKNKLYYKVIWQQFRKELYSNV